MTTIVADMRRRALVADRLVTTYSGLTQYRTEKLWRAGKSIFGGAGDVRAIYQFQRWTMDDMPKRGRPKFEHLADDDFSVLEIAPDGLFMWDTTMVREPVNEEVYAVGSGAKIALYCTKVVGLTAEEAIIEAGKIDMHTSGPVQVLAL